MTEEKLRKLYRDLLKDVDFDKLDLELKTPNIFHILGITREELKHSNFLVWLLDPNESHGLGRLFLTKFLREIAASEISKELDEFDIEKLNFNNVELRREWKNIDLLIVFDTHVICIENKFDSEDYSNQLAKYRKIICENFKNKKQIFVYLTPKGKLPKAIAEREFYIPYAYKNIIDQIGRILKNHGTSLSSGVHQYISDYLTTLKREITMDDSVNRLATKIYENHQELFDFVNKNKRDIAPLLNLIFLKKVVDFGWIENKSRKGDVRFLTKKTASFIPRRPQGAAVFQFVLEYWWYNKVRFNVQIDPTTPTAVKDILKNALENIQMPLRHEWEFNTTSMTEADVDEKQIREMLDKHWDKISDIVDKVEAELLKHKDELQKYC